MKTTITAFAAVLAFAASTAIAQPTPPAPVSPVLGKTAPVPGGPGSRLPMGSGTSLTTPGAQPGRGAPVDAKGFAKVKANTLQSLDDHITRITKDRKCVAAADEPKELLECRRAASVAQREVMKAQRARMGLPPVAQAGAGAPGMPVGVRGTPPQPDISKEAPRK